MQNLWSAYSEKCNFSKITYISSQNCLHTHVCMYAYMYACMYACMYARMYVCMYVELSKS